MEISPGIWVDLKGGTSLPLVAVDLAIELADQGWEVTRLEDKLILRPKTQNATKAQQNATPLSENLKMRIRAQRDYLLLVADYVAAL